jgi:hypothetical protein
MYQSGSQNYIICIMPVAGKSTIVTLEGASEQNRFTCSGNIFDRFTG